MAALDSKRRGIAIALVDRMKAINGDAGGYWNMVVAKNVTRGHIDLNRIDENATPRITVELGDEAVSDEQQPASTKSVMVLAATIRAHKFIGETRDPDELDDEAERLLRDVVKSLFVGTADLGSLVRTAIAIERAAKVVEQGRIGWVTAAVDLGLSYTLVWAEP